MLGKRNTIGEQKKSIRNQIGHQILRGLANCAYVHDIIEILLYWRIIQGTTCLGGYLTLYITKLG